VKARIVKFRARPIDPAAARVRLAEPCIVLILPVVRIERIDLSKIRRRGRRQP
jgi:hypothetical protein